MKSTLFVSLFSIALMASMVNANLLPDMHHVGLYTNVRRFKEDLQTQGYHMFSRQAEKRSAMPRGNGSGSQGLNYGPGTGQRKRAEPKTPSGATGSKGGYTGPGNGHRKRAEPKMSSRATGSKGLYIGSGNGGH